MATKPTVGPRWAFNAGVDRAVYPSILQAEGPDFGEPWTNKDLNGYQRNVGEWLDWLRTGGAYADLASALSETVAGESFHLEPLGVPYAESSDATGSLTGEISAIAIDGERCHVGYVVGTAGLIRSYLLADLADITTGNEDWTATGLGGTDTYTELASNGTYLIGIYDTEWRIYDATDGSSVYNGDHGAVLNGCAITENWALVVGVADGGDIQAVMIDLSDGTATDVPTWGAGVDLYNVDGLEDGVFGVVGEDDGSGNELAQISGGLAPGYDWRASLTNGTAAGSQLVCNGRFYFVHNGDSGAQLAAISPADGSEVWALTTFSATLPRLACDAKDLFLALDDTGLLLVVDPATGGRVREIAYSGAGAQTLRPPIAANSRQFVRGQVEAASLASVRSFASGLRTRQWRRESIAPHFQQATPEVL